MAAHKDFLWVSEEITYGLYLSDHSILGPVETELVVLGGIMMQNLPRETGWHLRGTRRIGVSMEDVETVQQCVSGSTRKSTGYEETNGFADREGCHFLRTHSESRPTGQGH